MPVLEQYAEQHMHACGDAHQNGEPAKQADSRMKRFRGTRALAI
jgi:hypothetical protein